jgi:DNA segregation ATPase FtsK/SpoIIIE, S-DNA-T family
MAGLVLAWFALGLDGRTRRRGRRPVQAVSEAARPAPRKTQEQRDEPRRLAPKPRRQSRFPNPLQRRRQRGGLAKGAAPAGPCARRQLRASRRRPARSAAGKGADADRPRRRSSATPAILESVLEDFHVRGDIVEVRPGPVVTMYELEPASGIKASRVIQLADDIARNMQAMSARVAIIPGRSVIGIELPNARARSVTCRS